MWSTYVGGKHILNSKSKKNIVVFFIFDDDMSSNLSVLSFPKQYRINHDRKLAQYKRKATI